MKKFNQVIITVALGLAFQLHSQKAQAWGTVGHHTSAQIAINILKDQNSPALAEIQKILSGDDFVEASTWADEARASTTQNWKDTAWYHFEKMDDKDKYISHLKTQTPEVRARGGTVQAILASEVVLLDPQTSAEDRKNALKFMIHFIGDIHQPLHTGRIADNGGNKVSVKWQGFTMNLHQIWDSQIIAYGHKNLFASGSKEEQIENYARFLQNKFKSVGFRDQNKVRYDEWVHESMAPRVSAYKYKYEGAAKYTARFLDTVDERIYLAGLRIAFTLNRLFPGYTGPGMATADGQFTVDQFKKDVMDVIGDFIKVINLRPSPKP